MPGAIATAFPSSSTQALFQAWAGKIADGLVASGMIRTTDTGQTAPAALPVVGVAGSMMGYEIYRFNDLLQATQPIFLRVEYRAGAITTSIPHLQLRVGTATDGAGNLSAATAHPGTLLPQISLWYSDGTPFANPTTVSQPIYAFGHNDGAAVAMMGFPSQGAGAGAVSWGGGFLIERTRDADGTSTARGLIFIQWSAAAVATAMNSYIALFNFFGTQPPAMGNSSLTPWNFATTAVEGSAVYPYPVFTGYSPRVNAPSKILAIAGRTDLPATTQYPMTHYGEAGTWVSMGNGSTTSVTGFGNFSGNSISAIQSPQMRIV